MYCPRQVVGFPFTFHFELRSVAIFALASRLIFASFMRNSGGFVEAELEVVGFGASFWFSRKPIVGLILGLTFFFFLRMWLVAQMCNG